MDEERPFLKTFTLIFLFKTHKNLIYINFLNTFAASNDFQKNNYIDKTAETFKSKKPRRDVGVFSVLSKKYHENRKKNVNLFFFLMTTLYFCKEIVHKYECRDAACRVTVIMYNSSKGKQFKR